MASRSKVIRTEDVNYKQGKIICKCGWSKELGDGFNKHYIQSCPECDPNLTTRQQRKVITGKAKNYNVTLGRHMYFALSNGIQVQYETQIYATYTSVSIQKANNL